MNIQLIRSMLISTTLSLLCLSGAAQANGTNQKGGGIIKTVELEGDPPPDIELAVAQGYACSLSVRSSWDPSLDYEGFKLTLMSLPRCEGESVGVAYICFSTVDSPGTPCPHEDNPIKKWGIYPVELKPELFSVLSDSLNGNVKLILDRFTNADEYSNFVSVAPYGNRVRFIALTN